MQHFIRIALTLYFLHLVVRGYIVWGTLGLLIAAVYYLFVGLLLLALFNLMGRPVKLWLAVVWLPAMWLAALAKWAKHGNAP